MERLGTGHDLLDEDGAVVFSEAAGGADVLELAPLVAHGRQLTHR